MLDLRVNIDENESVTDIIRRDYRTVSVFKEFGIDYGQNHSVSLRDICEELGIDRTAIETQLNEASQPNQRTPGIDYSNWDIDFLIDYIINIHHSYLRRRLPLIQEHFEQAQKTCSIKPEELEKLSDCFFRLQRKIIPHLQQEEEVLFPYVRQLAHAYADQEPYGSLLVKTMRKPVEDFLKKDHDILLGFLQQIRELTGQYLLPVTSCHQYLVLLQLLQELDIDLTQHFYLESSILYPRVLAMEKELTGISK